MYVLGINIRCLLFPVNPKVVPVLEFRPDNVTFSLQTSFCFTVSALPVSVAGFSP